jgi:hypothetical protein
MGTTGKISVIPKDYTTAFPSMEKSLRDNGYSMVPGCRKLFMPHKLPDGRYVTGLDEDALYIKKMEAVNPKDAELEKAKVRNRIADLQSKLGEVDLSPRSQFWSPKYNPNIVAFLKDGDNYFDTESAMEAIKFYYLSVHPKIASSLAAFNRGDCHAETHFFINNEDAEGEVVYQKNKGINDAIIIFSSYHIEKQRKIAKLLGEPIGDDAKDRTVYNAFNTFIKSNEIAKGPYRGQDPVRVFNALAATPDETLDIKFLMRQAFDNQIYRVKAGRVFEGELEVYASEDELFETLLNLKNQDVRFELEKKLKLAKLQDIT